jgi:hypothetical protein
LRHKFFIFSVFDKSQIGQTGVGARVISANFAKTEQASFYHYGKNRFGRGERQEGKLFAILAKTSLVSDDRQAQANFRQNGGNSFWQLLPKR